MIDNPVDDNGLETINGKEKPDKKSEEEKSDNDEDSFISSEPEDIEPDL